MKHIDCAVLRGYAIAVLVLLLTFSGGSAPAAGQSGLLAAGGTWTNPPDGPTSLGTVVAFRWRVEALTAEGFQFTLRGPAGWKPSSGVHRVSVAAFPSDITFPLTVLPKQYNCSEGSATFMVP